MVASALFTNAVEAARTHAGQHKHKKHSQATHRHHTPPPATKGVIAAQKALSKTRNAKHALIQQKEQVSSTITAQKKESAEKQALAEQARVKATRLSNAVIAATERLQKTEHEVSLLEGRIRELDQERLHIKQQLKEDAKALAPFFPLIERLSLYPADTLLAAPVAPQKAVTGLLVLRRLSSSLEARARLVRQRKEKLDSIEKELSARTAHLHSLVKTQTAQRDEVNQAAQAAKQEQKKANAVAEKATASLLQATQKARNLDDAIRRIDLLEEQKQKILTQETEAARRLAEAQEAARLKAQRLKNERMEAARRAKAGENRSKQAPAPAAPAPSGAISAGSVVAGSLIRGWGAPTVSGPATGLLYAASAGAVVRAPCSGSVDFSGSFRSYGQMVILHCGQHYRFVVAGLGAIDVAIGQSVSKGAPIGRMPDGGGHPTLYLQLRHGTRAVNPASHL